MNISHLKHDCVTLGLEALISNFHDKATNENHFSLYWELFKSEVGKYLGRYGDLARKM